MRCPERSDWEVCGSGVVRRCTTPLCGAMHTWTPLALEAPNWLDELLALADPPRGARP
eukprot:CAMPEP_0194555290 /NCGR_PEP_ID=MMETSP0253-20130528/98169_1 /TAXON_ID=2966 /ORGANISM="Noctiluca scintillans" /LENGTH=57 /DNA_ID=CAMNT_0039402789 /DNA_START=540 /DNA_END=709 /DNA_ORIENTATION=-